MVIGLAAGLIAALLFGAPAAMQAHASRRLPQAVWWRVLLAGAHDKVMVTVVVLYLLGAVASFVAIQSLPLYLAQAATSVQLIFTALASAWWLHEWPFAHQWGALVTVAIGLGLLAVGAGKAGGEPEQPHLLLGLYGGAALTALLGYGVSLARGHGSGVLLGLLAGVAFAGIPLGIRLVEEPYLRLETFEALVVISMYGVIGFVLSSVSLTRVQVNTATAPLIFAETIIPACLGIALFGDQVRSGWGWVIVLGLALSMVGTLGVAAVARPLTEEAAEKVDL